MPLYRWRHQKGQMHGGFGHSGRAGRVARRRQGRRTAVRVRQAITRPPGRSLGARPGLTSPAVPRLARHLARHPARRPARHAARHPAAHRRRDTRRAGGLLQPLSNELIAAVLDARGYRYFTDSDGDIGGRWDDHVIYFFRFGSERGDAPGPHSVGNTFTTDDVPQLYAFCNEWNHDRLWPKAYVHVYDDGVARVCGEVMADLKVGVAFDQLDPAHRVRHRTGLQLAEPWRSCRTRDGTPLPGRPSRHRRPAQPPPLRQPAGLRARAAAERRRRDHRTAGAEPDGAAGAVRHRAAGRRRRPRPRHRHRPDRGRGARAARHVGRSSSATSSASPGTSSSASSASACSRASWWPTTIEVATRSADGRAGVRWTGSPTASTDRYRADGATRSRTGRRTRRLEPGTTVTLRPRAGAEHWFDRRSPSWPACSASAATSTSPSTARRDHRAGRAVGGRRRDPGERRAALLAYGRERARQPPVRRGRPARARGRPARRRLRARLGQPGRPGRPPGLPQAHAAGRGRREAAAGLGVLRPLRRRHHELRPTASREALYDDDLLASVREALGEQLRGWLLDLSVAPPGPARGVPARAPPRRQGAGPARRRDAAPGRRVAAVGDQRRRDDAARVPRAPRP